LFPVPRIADCGTCNGISHEKGNQCAFNGFCVDGDLELPLTAGVGTFTADASGTVRIGWDELLLPVPVNANSPAGPSGARFYGAGIQGAFECTMGVAGSVVGTVNALNDADLISLPILP
jgi:hypothetical protein